MKLSWKTVAKIGLPVALCLLFSLALAQDRGAGTIRPWCWSWCADQQRRIGMDPVDDRVQLREYHFNDTDETLPYAVFVSTKVTKDKKAPLVLALHGFSGNHGTFMRTQCVDEAEKNGYILVGAMGYSPSGSFGMPMGGRGAPGSRVGPADALARQARPMARRLSLSRDRRGSRWSARTRHVHGYEGWARRNKGD